MNIKQVLEEIGVGKTKADVYLAALEIGSGTAEEIGKQAGIPRTTAHEVLQQLLSKGLVALTMKGRRRIYTPESPQKLQSILHEQERRLLEVLPKLLSIHNTSSTRPRVRFYEGAEGIRTVFEDTLKSKTKTLSAILSIQDIDKIAGAKWFANYTKRRIESGRRLNVIRSSETEVEDKYPSSKSENREVHYAEPGMVFNLSVYLYDNKVAFFGTMKEPYAMLIESEDLHQTLFNLFEVLWQVTHVQKAVDV
ncbi:MAG: Transcriptional regulator, TrmB [Parcubacteria group bacterium GW2011_GWA2_56_7]|nr:MAG: Transcriptional regulator, TrmB [Parcubacteria group bacterium GW2011_GWA2_56_7]